MFSSFSANNSPIIKPSECIKLNSHLCLLIIAIYYFSFIINSPFIRFIVVVDYPVLMFIKIIKLISSLSANFSGYSLPKIIVLWSSYILYPPSYLGSSHLTKYSYPCPTLLIFDLIPFIKSSI
jgi:hypothetical protein